MSGHSHFSTIKRKKEITDQKRGQIFSKLARMISVAVKEKGADPEMNAKLKLAIEKARASNMPKDNIERAIKQAGSKGENDKLEEVIYEAYGPGGAAIIIEGITDNKNRTLGEIKKIFSNYQAKMVGEGGVRWLFERKVNQETNSLEWLPKQELELSQKDEENCQKIFEALDENEAVQEIYSNIKQ